MKQTITLRGSLTISMLLASALYAGCGSSNGSDNGASAGSAGSVSTAGSAGSISAAGSTQPSAGATAMGGASTGSSGSAGSNTSGAPSMGGTNNGGSSGSNSSAGSGGKTNAGGSAGNAGSAGKAGASGSAGAGGAAAIDCKTSDPLKTNNTKQDAYDCAIIDVAKKWGMPDPMIVKSQIQQESNFGIFAISGDSPCGTMQGWTDAESKSFGLIQTTPACGEAKSALLPNGHPNLTQDMNSALWATSVFNPPINLDEGVKTDADGRTALKKKYPTCTDAQYNMMAAGAFNSGDSAVLGCTSYNTRAQTYVTYITQHYHAFAKAAGWPDPY